MEKCSAENCEKERKKHRSYCSRHAAQIYKYGKITNTKPSYRDLNEIIDCGDGTARIVIRSKTGDVVANAIIDSDKISIVSGIKWYLHSSNYVASKGKFGSSYLHRVVSGFVGSVDHINMNPLDNRVVNLRECNQSQNLANTKARSNSKTGVKGVHRYKGGSKYYSQIAKDRKVYCLGVFDTIDDAKRAYDKKAVELFGEFARS